MALELLASCTQCVEQKSSSDSSQFTKWKLCKHTYSVVGQGSVAIIATRYRLDGLGIETWQGVKFSAPIQTTSGAHPTSCTLDTRSFPGVMWPGLGIDHSPHITLRLRKEQSYTSTPTVDVHGLFQDELYLYMQHHSASHLYCPVLVCMWFFHALHSYSLCKISVN